MHFKIEIVSILDILLGMIISLTAFKKIDSKLPCGIIIALNIIFSVFEASAASKIIPNNSPNLYSSGRTTACGQSGSLQERIKDCNEFIILKESKGRITTVSIDIREGRLERWLLDESTQKIWSPPAKVKMNFPNAENYCKNLNKAKLRPLGISNWSLPLVKNDYIEEPDLTGGLFSAFNNPPVNRFGGLTSLQDDKSYRGSSKNPLVKKVFSTVDAFWVYKSTEKRFKRWLSRNESDYGEVESLFATAEGRDFLAVGGITNDLYVLCQSGKIRKGY